MNKHLTMSLNSSGSSIEVKQHPEFEALEIEGWQCSAFEDVGLFT